MYGTLQQTFQNLFSIQTLITTLDKLSQSHPYKVDPILQGHEGDAKEETERSSELGEESGHRVEAEQEALGFVGCWHSVAFYFVLQVVAGL